VLTGAFASGVAGLATWMRAANRELPERIGPGDLALMTVATHKAARLLAKDRVTSTVRARSPASRATPAGRGVGGCSREGPRRAVGELIVCPERSALHRVLAFL